MPQEASGVPRNLSGPVPGIEVGQWWEKRIDISKCGVHPPTMAGIHGREYECAYSIVLSGLYDEDEDDGEKFLYSGCGGKEKKRGVRLNVQIKDQELTRYNKALALCCAAPLNDKNGAKAKDWRSGKPVRVIRKHGCSNYGPVAHFRYDGIYKVVEYFPKLGKNNLKVWTYLLRRDDPAPAPWTIEGQERIKSLGLEIPTPTKRVILDRKRRSTSQTKLPKRTCLESMFYDDVKPDIKKLEQLAANINIPWSTTASDEYSKDVKPNLLELNRIIYQNCNTLQNKKESDIDIEEDNDIKPDVNYLNAMINLTERNALMPISPLKDMLEPLQTECNTPLNVEQSLNPALRSSIIEPLKIKIFKVTTLNMSQKNEGNEDDVAFQIMKRDNVLESACIEIKRSLELPIHVRDVVNQDV